MYELEEEIVCKWQFLERVKGRDYIYMFSIIYFLLALNLKRAFLFLFLLYILLLVK